MTALPWRLRRRQRGLSRLLSRWWRDLSRWWRWGTRRTTSEYRLFMASPAWAEQRRRVLQRDGYRCRWCGRAGREAHHLYYAVPLVATPDEGITTLCEPCHLRAHQNKAQAPTSRRLW